MTEEKQRILDILQFNKGFTHPERWIEYGLIHNFERIQAVEVQKCPDCKSRSFSGIGQYVYYSTLVTLQACARCNLIFADKQIDPHVVRSHFERAYKDEAYFLDRRRRIFRQLSALADGAAVQGGNVLDIGGAKGHLLAMLRKQRADLRFAVLDLSEEACKYAAHEYGFQTICGGIDALPKNTHNFHVIIMSDVLYYEPELDKLWVALPGFLAKNGTVIIRVPNKLLLIRLWQIVIRAIRGRANTEMQDHMRFFNPEHLYVFTRPYLEKRLRELGFTQVTTVPADLLVRNRGSSWYSVSYFWLCKLLFTLTRGKWILTPSMLVIARIPD